MYKIYCDETWTTEIVKVPRNYFVFYGVMVVEENEDQLLCQIDEFKRQRGLVINSKPVEIKWVKVEEEWRNAKSKNRTSRYEEFLDIFFQALKSKTLSFGYMYLPKLEYDRVEQEFVRKDPDSKHEYFFMLCYQFLYHCFIKPQVKHSPCQIFIDNRDVGAAGRQYDIERLKEILNKRIYRDAVPKYQLQLHHNFTRQLSDSVQLVNLSESKQEPLIQLADLCGGCVRYTLENQLSPPNTAGQTSLFSMLEPPEPTDPKSGKEELAIAFYRKLRTIENYKDIDLFKLSYHHRFNIFPFEFRS